MFDSEEDDIFDGAFQEDLQRFEDMLKNGDSLFFDADRLETIIDHFLISNQFKKALDCVSHALSHFPYNNVFKIRKAQILSGTGKLNEALNILFEVEKIDPNDQELILTKASIYSQLRQTKRAIKYFEKALLQSDGEEKDEIYLDLAMEYQNLHNIPEAIRVLKDALESNKENETAVYELAFCYDQLGQLADAIQCYDDYINLHPYSFTAWYNLGNTYSKVNDSEKATWAYEYCTLINDSFASAYFNWGNALISLEKYRAAIDVFEKCMEIDGEDGLTLNYMGECFEQLEEYDLALHYYKRSIDLTPELADPWLGLGIVYDLMGDSVKGLNFIQKAIDMEPDNASFWHVFAGCSEKNGTIDLAMNAFKHALFLDPLNDQILFDYSKLWSTLSLVEARDFVEKYIKEQSIEGISQIELVRLNWLTGRQTIALTSYKDLVFSDQDTAKTLFLHFPEAENISQLVELYELIEE